MALSVLRPLTPPGPRGPPALLLLLLCVCGLAVADELLPKGPLNALAGSTATFRTLLKNPEFTIIMWSFNDGTDVHPVATLTPALLNVNDRYKGRANMDANGTLTLATVTAADSGEYSISIIDKLANTKAAETDLRVMVSVSEVVVVSSVPEALELNTSVVLKCTAKGSHLSFSWLNVSTAITADGSRTKVTQDETSSSLSFTSVYRTDLVGPIFCSVSNALSSAKSPAFSLTIHYGPEQVALTPAAPPAFLASKSNFSLTCSAVSSPASSFTWFSDERPLEVTGPTLTLKEIEQLGLARTRTSFTCQANNAKTKKSVPSPPVAFTVIEQIAGVRLSGPSGRLFAGNSSANLSCAAAKGAVDTVAWLKDGMVLSAGGRVVMAPDLRSVLIDPLQKDDNGEFTCEMSNPVNKEAARVTLTVFYGPEPLVLTGQSQVEVTDAVTLECSSSSMPPANYSWKFNGTITAVTDSRYVIEKASYANTGTYTCEARNTATGRAEHKSHFLSVKEEGALDEGLSDGAIAGIVIGVLAAVALAIGLFIYCRQKVPLESPY